MTTDGTPNTIVLEGYDADGTEVLRLQLDVAKLPEAKHLWEDFRFIASRRIARLTGDLFDADGKLEQRYERHYNRDGRYQGGTITYADGRTLTANTAGLEPSTVRHGDLVFTVHYLHQTSNSQAPAW